MEKTFADGMISGELLIPFANMPGSTNNNPNGTVGAAPSEVELLDIAFGLKALLLQTENASLSAGFRVEAPTRDDTEFPNATGPYIVEQEVWKVTPYLALLLTPSDDIFFQAFAAYRMPTTDLVEVPGDGSGPFALREPNYLQLDAQLGKWLYRNAGGSGLTGLQAKLELHYTGTFEPYNPENTFNFGASTYGGETDTLNLTTGLTALLNDKTTIRGTHRTDRSPVRLRICLAGQSLLWQLMSVQSS